MDWYSLKMCTNKIHGIYKLFTCSKVYNRKLKDITSNYMLFQEKRANFSYMTYLPFWISLVSLRILMKYLPPDFHINFYDLILGNSELQVPQDGDKKSCFSIQKFACVYEYFPVYTSVHFPDHEMEWLCMHTVTRQFYLKCVLFSSQCVYPISNINIYFLLMFRSSVQDVCF